MRTRKALMAGAVAGSVALGGLIGALVFAAGPGIAQTDDEKQGEVTVAGWCFGDGEGPFAVAAGAIGIPHGDLLYAMRQGSTIAEVAGSEGVDAQVVIDALVASMQDRLDAAVEDGFFSQEVADEIAGSFQEHAANVVNGGFPGFGRGPGFGHGPWGHGARGEASSEADAGMGLF